MCVSWYDILKTLLLECTSHYAIEFHITMIFCMSMLLVYYKGILYFLNHRKQYLLNGYKNTHCVKSVCILSFSDLHFLAFYFVSLRIQFECGKIRARGTPRTHFTQWYLVSSFHTITKKPKIMIEYHFEWNFRWVTFWMSDMELEQKFFKTPAKLNSIKTRC